MSDIFNVACAVSAVLGSTPTKHDNKYVKWHEHYGVRFNIKSNVLELDVACRDRHRKQLHEYAKKLHFTIDAFDAEYNFGYTVCNQPIIQRIEEQHDDQLFVRLESTGVTDHEDGGRVTFELSGDAIKSVSLSAINTNDTEFTLLEEVQGELSSIVITIDGNQELSGFIASLMKLGENLLLEDGAL